MAKHGGGGHGGGHSGGGGGGSLMDFGLFGWEDIKDLFREMKTGETFAAVASALALLLGGGYIDSLITAVAGNETFEKIAGEMKGGKKGGGHGGGGKIEGGHGGGGKSKKGGGHGGGHH